MKIAVFWVVAPCSLVEVYQRFRLHGATTQKTAIFENKFSRQLFIPAISGHFLLPWKYRTKRKQVFSKLNNTEELTEKNKFHCNSRLL
jgi:hypothetical protein